MAFINGTNVIIGFETEEEDVFTYLYCAKDASIDIAADLLKVTDTVNGQFAAFTGSGVSGTMTTSGLMRIDAAYDFRNLAAATLALTKIKVRFTIQDMGGSDAYFEAFGFITSLSGSATVFSLAENSVTIQLSGLITIN